MWCRRLRECLHRVLCRQLRQPSRQLRQPSRVLCRQLRVLCQRFRQRLRQQRPASRPGWALPWQWSL